MSPAPRRHNPNQNLGFSIDQPARPQPAADAPARRSGAWAWAVRLANAAWLCVNVVAALGLVCSAYASWVNPAEHPLSGFVSLTFAGWFWAAILLLGLDLVWWKRTAWVPGLAMLACVGAISDYMPLNLPHWGMSQEEREHSFTLMTYNVYSMNDYQGVDAGFCRQLEYILQQNPDVACLQEARFLIPTAANRITPQQIDSMHAAYPYVMMQGEDFALLSKFPVEPINIDPPAELFASGNIAAWRLRIDDKVVNIFSVHLRSFGLTDEDKGTYRELIRLDSISRRELSAARSSLIPKVKDAARDRSLQIAYLQKCLQRYGGKNAIVVGDFNDTETSYAVRALCDGSHMRQAWAEAGFGPMTTYNASNLYFRIDHVLYRGAMRPYKMRRASLRASDHYPLTVTFVMDPK